MSPIRFHPGEPPDQEGPDYRLLSTRYLTARKEHRCVLCPDPIRPGSRYVRTVSIEDGRFACDRRHYFCRV